MHVTLILAGNEWEEDVTSIREPLYEGELSCSGSWDDDSEPGNDLANWRVKRLNFQRRVHFCKYQMICQVVCTVFSMYQINTCTVFWLKGHLVLGGQTTFPFYLWWMKIRSGGIVCIELCSNTLALGGISKLILIRLTSLRHLLVNTPPLTSHYEFLLIKINWKFCDLKVI